MSEKIQKIEVRAFGCLVEDLLTQLAPEELDLEIAKDLVKLKTELMQENVKARLLFEEVIVRLARIASLA